MMMNPNGDGRVLDDAVGHREMKRNPSDDEEVRVAAAADHRARYVDLDREPVVDGGVDLGPP